MKLRLISEAHKTSIRNLSQSKTLLKLDENYVRSKLEMPIFLFENHTLNVIHAIQIEKKKIEISEKSDLQGDLYPQWENTQMLNGNCDMMNLEQRA